MPVPSSPLSLPLSLAALAAHHAAQRPDAVVRTFKLRDRFADLEERAVQCKFADCQHGPSHAGCAIQAAIAAGALDPKRLEGFLKLDKEIALLRQNRQKRQLTVRRRTRRDNQSQSRKFSDRHLPDSEYDR